MKSYPLFRKENIPAYLTMMSAWATVAVIAAFGLTAVVPGLPMLTAVIWAGASVMSGMGIMFVASAINLRKLGPGFRRLAEGQRDPQIPPVWCPVLTAATNAALELEGKLLDQPEGAKPAGRA
ncbi:MAG: hypothetical protein ABR553_02650 [Gammaproteobacteria bacterium]